MVTLSFVQELLHSTSKLMNDSNTRWPAGAVMVHEQCSLL